MVTDNLAKLEERLGYHFANQALLLEALTHSSYPQEQPDAGPNNQRLEFLGDSVLQFILTDALYREFPAEREGALSRRRAVLAKGDCLAQLARDLGLATCLRISPSEEESGGRDRLSTLEDAFEAIVGAVFLDSDLATTQRLVLAWYGPFEQRVASTANAENPKGQLQEIVQPVHGNMALSYEVNDTTGPRHARTYHVDVLLKGEKIGSGSGTSKKLAEEAAARIALIHLRAQSGETAK